MAFGADGPCALFHTEKEKRRESRERPPADSGNEGFRPAIRTKTTTLPSSDRESEGTLFGSRSVAGAEARTIRKPAREGLRQERAGHATYKRPTPGTNLTFRVNTRKRGAGLPGWLRSRGLNSGKGGRSRGKPFAGETGVSGDVRGPWECRRLVRSLRHPLSGL